MIFVTSRLLVLMFFECGINVDFLGGAGTEIPSGGPVIDDKIPFDVHFPEHFEVAGQTPDSPNVEKKADQSHSESADASVVPEGHMVNPITGKIPTSTMFLMNIHLKIFVTETIFFLQ